MTLVDVFTNFALTCFHNGKITYLSANLTYKLVQPAILNDEIFFVINMHEKKKKHALTECSFYN